MGPPAPQALGGNLELAADINYRIKKNQGLFTVPVYNHNGDPHDKYGKHASWNRMMLSRRDGVAFSQPTELWKEVVQHEKRYQASAAAPPAAAPAAAAPAPAPPGAMPPGWYYVPSLGLNGQPTQALTYIPYWFAAPPGM